MSKLAEYLNRQMVGNVYERAAICDAYSTDSSILKITPKLVAFPESADDIRHLLRFIYQLAVRDMLLPVTARGGGHDSTGASIGPGLILSTERMNHIEEIDVRGRLVRAQPGVTLGQLNSALRMHGLWLPVKASPSSTIGGLIASGAHDSYIGRYGGIRAAVEEAEIILPSGDLILLTDYRRRALDAKIYSRSVEGLLYEKLGKILDDHADIVIDRSTLPSDFSGYANITQITDNGVTNLLPLMFGSQGTLGIISDTILNVELLPRGSERIMLVFSDLPAAEHFLASVAELEPYILEIYDMRLFELASREGKKVKSFGRRTKGYMVMLGFDQGKLKNHKLLDECLGVVPLNTMRIDETPENARDFTIVDKIIDSYFNNDPEGIHPPVMDNVFVPGVDLLKFTNGLLELEEILEQPLPFYGSYSSESYNVRPSFDITSLSDRRKIVEFIKLYDNLVSSCQGSVTGTSPEGRVKALVSEKRLSVGERQIYAAVKEAFDPRGILNPGVKLGADVRDTIRHLRTTETDKIISL